MTQATDIDMKEIRDLFLNLDKRIDGIDKKIDVYIAQNTEQLKGLETNVNQQLRALDTQLSDFKKSTDTQFADIKIQLRAQDTRLWGFIVTLSLAIIGFLSKLAFFPQT